MDGRIMRRRADFVHIVVGARCGTPSALGGGEGETGGHCGRAPTGAFSICGGSLDNLHRHLAAKRQAGEHDRRASAISSSD